MILQYTGLSASAPVLQAVSVGTTNAVSNVALVLLLDRFGRLYAGFGTLAFAYFAKKPPRPRTAPWNSPNSSWSVADGHFDDRGFERAAAMRAQDFSAQRCSAPRPSDRSAVRHVLLVSASIGAGHDHAAAELGRRLRSVGCRTTSVDVLELGNGAGLRMRGTYARLLRYAPAVYGRAMQFWARWPAPLEHLVAARSRGVEDDLQQLAVELQPDLVVSLYNLASQCLGRLRVAGRLTVPVVTYVTDPGAHPYWIHPGVDRHLAVLPVTAEGLRAYGALGAQVAGPLVRPELRHPVDRDAARRRLGLPSGPVVLLSSGSWACARTPRAVDRLLGCTTVTPVVLCGRNRALQREVASRSGVVALGWVEDMSEVLAAADVVVDNAGGLTCIEAMVAGRPVVLFEVLAGHGQFNAATLERCGAATWVRRASDLGPTVQRLARDPVAAGEQAARVQAMLTGDPARSVLASWWATA